MKLRDFKKLLLLVFILFCGFSVQSQTGPLKITVNDSDNIALGGAAVKLLNTIDSVEITKMTDKEGTAYFNSVSNVIYSVKISFIGYKSIDTLIRSTQSKRNFKFKMEVGSIALSEVSIIGKKPLIRQEEDKMIVDPAPIANIASNTLEVLESTPGLYVDQDGGVYLNGATPASIHINGREQKLSNQDIQTILRSLPPNSIEKIEIIRTPSTKYDASSSGGIINIVLKKGVKIGRFGSVNMSFNQGQFSRYSLGLSFNNSTTNSSSYININTNLFKTSEDLNTKRFLGSDSTITQAAIMTTKHIPFVSSFGLNYEFSPRLSLSYDGRINYTDRTNNSSNLNTVEVGTDQISSESKNNSASASAFWNLQQDVGLLFKFDTAGSELNTKLSYNFSHNKSDQDYGLSILKPYIFDITGNGLNNQNRHFYTLESDLTYRLFWKIKLETGLKSSVQRFSSASDYFLKLNNNSIPDSTRTNAFKYTDNINAAYLQISRELFAGINIKTGVRVENTYMKGEQSVPADTSFIVNRTDFFPYIYLSRRVFKIMGAELFGYLIYRKSINRPGYHELNPYIRFVDQYLYETGNPSLLPQFTDNVELNLSYNDMPVFALGRNVTKDIFSNVMYNDPKLPYVIAKTYDNVGTNKEIYLRGIFGIPPGSKYFFAIGAQLNITDYEGVYDNQPWKFSNKSWRFFTFHSLTLTQDTKLNLTGFIMTNGQWNFYEIENIGQLNLSLTQTFLNKKLTIGLICRDIFKTMNYKFKYNQGNINSTGNRISDSRWFGMNIRYNFGIGKKDEKKSIPAFEEPEF